MSQWGEDEIKEAVSAVQNAGGDVKSFLDDIEKNNPTVRTVRDDIWSLLQQAKGAANAAGEAGREGLDELESTPVIGPVVQGVENACESEPDCGVPPP